MPERYSPLAFQFTSIKIHVMLSILLTRKQIEYPLVQTDPLLKGNFMGSNYPTLDFDGEDPPIDRLMESWGTILLQNPAGRFKNQVKVRVFHSLDHTEALSSVYTTRRAMTDHSSCGKRRS